MNLAVSGPRSRWVGPPVSGPPNERGRSPSGRQRHYGAVELAGAGESVYVNDVVEVLEGHRPRPSEEQQQRPRLAQVLSMWEDTFTGVFKFRARWVMNASDLPKDALSRLRAVRSAFANNNSIVGSGVSALYDDGDTQPGNAAVGNGEVFLTPSVADLEVRLITRPVTLSVTTSPTTQIPPKWKGKTGPRLTHAFNESTGEFVLLHGTDAILKRARVRQSETVALASRADQESKAAKNGKPVVKSNGWLLPKRGVFDKRSRGVRGGSGSGRGTSVGRSTSSGHANSPIVDVDDSDYSDPEEPSISKDEEWKESDNDGNTTDTDDDLSASKKRRITPTKDFTPRKSARQQALRQSPGRDRRLNFNSNDCSYSPAPPTWSPLQRRLRKPPTKRPAPLPPRPRRLAMPPVKGDPTVSLAGGHAAPAAILSQKAAKTLRPARTRTEAEDGVTPSQALTSSLSTEATESAPRQSSISGRRKRGAAAKNAVVDQVDYPPRHTPVGKDYQIDIPDLLLAKDRKPPPKGTGARMVWRSIRDWDPHSRKMLDDFLHEAKKVVQAKQARPGVAVHVRLGGNNSGDRDDRGVHAMDTANSYAVWAVTAGRDVSGVVRVACSEMAQTEVPRAAIQRAQCEEEALAALIKTRCILDNFEPALDMLAKNKASPQSIEPWTLTQVRTLERILEEEYNPNRRLCGWARPGMEMDREDFIDLATVSTRVPGKAPEQVLSFYYRYLAAAEPLTDVVYGPEAAEARRQEEFCSAREAKPPPPCNERKTRGSVHANTATPGAGQPLIEQNNAKRATGDSGDKGEAATTPKNTIYPVSTPDAAGPLVSSIERNIASTTGHARESMRPGRIDRFPPTRTSATRPSEVYALPRETANHADNKRTPFDGVAATTGDRSIHGSSGDGSGGNGKRSAVNANRDQSRAVDLRVAEGGADDRNGEEVARRRPRGQDGAISRSLPPGAEVLEVEDGDDDVGGGETQGSLSAGPERRPFVVQTEAEATARNLNNIGPDGLLSEARPMRRQAMTAAAPASRQSGVLPVVPRPVPNDSGERAQARGESPAQAWDGYRREAAGCPDVYSQRVPRWRHPQPTRSNSYATHTRGIGARVPDGEDNQSCIENGKIGISGGHTSSDTSKASEQVASDEMFGFMAPCWRLLDRAKEYMDQEQLLYMRGLILAHVKKPMSRNQLLERAQSCFQDQGKIFTAFVKMFDRIDQVPLVPLYAAEKPPGPAAGSKQYGVRCSPVRVPVSSAHVGLTELQLRLARAVTFEADDHTTARADAEDRWRCSGPRSSIPHQPPPGAGMPVNGGVTVCPQSMAPYPRGGGNSWRLNDGGNESTVVNRNGGTRYAGNRVGHIPPRRSFALPPPLVPTRAAGYIEGGHQGYDGAMRKPWSQQLQRQWPMGANASVAAVAAAAEAESEAARRGEWHRGADWGSRGHGSWR